MHSSQSKSTRCEIFAWNFDFSETTYCKDSKPAPLDLACLTPNICTTQAISTHFSQSKSTKCEIFGCFLNSPWQKVKKCQFVQGKSVQKGLKICTCRFLGMPIAMHYVRTLCDKSFLSYDGFSCCSFIENTSVKQSMKHKVCSNFETSFLHLGQMDPPVEASSGREQY